jgi:lipopolysaccharide export system protein LptA
MNKKTLAFVLTAATLCTMYSPFKAFATKVDLEAEISIKSDRQSVDLKNKILDYINNVVITQGTLSISADIVQIYTEQDSKRKSNGDTYLAKGKPAVFQQTLEDGSIITLEADKITYQPELFLVVVSGNAKVKQASSEVSGSEITYNIATERLDAMSNSNEQVTTILQPNAIKKTKEAKDKSSQQNTSKVDELNLEQQ